jgi:Putative transposase
MPRSAPSPDAARVYAVIPNAIFIIIDAGTSRWNPRSRCAGNREHDRPDYATQQAQCGAITLIQRFGSALNLNIHYHMLVPDGVYLTEINPPYFRKVPAPTPDRRGAPSAGSSQQ